jgi:hypothetical protein
MKTIITQLLHRIYLFIVVKVLYTQKPIAYYFSNFFENEGINDAKKMNAVKCAHHFYTDHSIKFRSIPLHKNLYHFVSVLGTPAFKLITKYSNAKQNMFLYHNKFSDFNVHTVINSLDNTILNCAYHIDIESPERLQQLKKVFKRKYNVEIDNANEFIISDPHGNQLHFRYLFKATVTYINGNAQVKEKIDQVVQETYRYNASEEHQVFEKLKWSF